MSEPWTSRTRSKMATIGNTDTSAMCINRCW
jgi:hypothetical protein